MSFLREKSEFIYETPWSDSVVLRRQRRETPVANLRRMRHIYGMPLGFLRGLLGAFCILFAYSLGRSSIRMVEGRERRSKLLAWTLRTLVTGAAVAFRAGFDTITLVVFALAIASYAGGAYLEWRPKPHEELDKLMFPRE